MFIVASSGRCGTLALCQALNAASDHVVEHEPDPRLLPEAYLKHTGQPHLTPVLSERLRFFRERDGERYGQTFRAANLLPEIMEFAPRTRFLIMVRHPLEYVLSANYMRVFQRGDEWDQTRLMPLDVEFDQLPLASKIAWHWQSVNSYLLDFAASHSAMARVAVLDRIEDSISDWASFLGIRITAPKVLEDVLLSRPNRSETKDQPEGFNEEALGAIVASVWARAQSMSGWISG